eukprot:scaffold355361_cov19-Prasinocladus_malaysianus.AAC.1
MAAYTTLRDSDWRLISIFSLYSSPPVDVGDARLLFPATQKDVISGMLWSKEPAHTKVSSS